MPETVSVPDHETVKLVVVCAAARLATEELGGVVSSLIVSEAATDTLWSASRNWAWTVLVPSPALSVKGRLVAKGCQVAPVKALSSDSRIWVTPTLSVADRVSVTLRVLVKLAPLLMTTEAPLGLTPSDTRVHVSGVPG